MPLIADQEHQGEAFRFHVAVGHEELAEFHGIGVTPVLSDQGVETALDAAEFRGADAVEVNGFPGFEKSALAGGGARIGGIPKRCPDSAGKLPGGHSLRTLY